MTNKESDILFIRKHYTIESGHVVFTQDKSGFKQLCFYSQVMPSDMIFSLNQIRKILNTLGTYQGE